MNELDGLHVTTYNTANAYEADVKFLRGRGCMCPLRIDTGTGNTIQRAIPATGCEINGERVVCPKRLSS